MLLRTGSNYKMSTFAQSCLCIIRARGFCVASQFSISYIYLLLKEKKLREHKCSPCHAFYGSIYILLQGFFSGCFGLTMVFIDFFFFPFNTLNTAVTPENDVCRGYRCFCGGIKGVIPAHISIPPIWFPKQRNGMFTSQI